MARPVVVHSAPVGVHSAAVLFVIQAYARATSVLMKKFHPGSTESIDNFFPRFRSTFKRPVQSLEALDRWTGYTRGF